MSENLLLDFKKPKRTHLQISTRLRKLTQISQKTYLEFTDPQCHEDRIFSPRSFPFNQPTKLKKKKKTHSGDVQVAVEIKNVTFESFKVQILSFFIHFMQMSLYRRYNREILHTVGLNNREVDDKTKSKLVLILKQTEHANQILSLIDSRGSNYILFILRERDTHTDKRSTETVTNIRLPSFANPTLGTALQTLSLAVIVVFFFGGVTGLDIVQRRTTFGRREWCGRSCCGAFSIYHQVPVTKCQERNKHIIIIIILVLMTLYITLHEIDG